MENAVMKFGAVMFKKMVFCCVCPFSNGSHHFTTRTLQQSKFQCLFTNQVDDQDGTEGTVVF